MNKKIIAVQAVVCICITAVAAIGENTKSPVFSSYYDMFSEQVMHQITMEEVVNAKDKALEVLKSAPAALTSTIAKVNSQSKYGQAIDEKSNEETLQVHAVAGGVVVQSGRTETLGMFVKIKHDEAVSVYGQMETINVVEDERVQKGEIIGSYNKTSDKEFYFQLKENV